MEGKLAANANTSVPIKKPPIDQVIIIGSDRLHGWLPLEVPTL